MTTTTIRDLRNRFPEIRKIVEAEGEVIVTDKGEPKYRLTLYTPAPSRKAPAGKDYVARMKRYQPRALSEAEAEALHEENRGDR